MLIAWSGSWKFGSWWVRWRGGHGLALKAPWNKPRFSEREGYRKPLVVKTGWRLFKLNP